MDVMDGMDGISMYQLGFEVNICYVKTAMRTHKCHVVTLRAQDDAKLRNVVWCDVVACG